MDKPRAYIHVKTTSKFSEFGVLVIGRNAIPVYIILNVTLILSILLLIVGGIVASVSGGTVWWPMISSAVPMGLMVVGLVVLGAVNMIRYFAQDIKQATKTERGL